MTGAIDYMKRIFNCEADDGVLGYMSSYSGSCPTSDEPVNQYAAGAGIKLTDDENSNMFLQQSPFDQPSPFFGNDIRTI